jgi:hypothetical protein
MHLSLPTHALLRGVLAGAVAIAGASACSRSDRTETGSDTTAAVLPDTTSATADNQGAQPTATDTRGAPRSDAGTATARQNAPRAETATPQRTSGADTSNAAGYRAMERDTAARVGEPTDTARATGDSTLAPGDQSSLTASDSSSEVTASADTSVGSVSVAVSDTSSTEMAGAATDTAAGESASADTATADYAEMARDTSTTADQLDTTAHDSGHPGAVVAGAVVGAAAAGQGRDRSDEREAQHDASAKPENNEVDANTGRVRPPEDSTEAPGQVTSDPTATAVASADTAAESEPIRPPEDSIGIRGNATVDEDTGNAGVTREDQEDVATSETRTDEVGAAALGGNVNGADAVSLMTRQGAQCMVVDPETAQGVLVDMSDTPVTLNPCGLGSMVLSKIWTRKE